ncbi:zinc-ribbon domain-containing protein [bacterium]|nr:zinc-ribbon domain-containing protein [bacterium]
MKPDEVSSKQNKKVWWKCKNGHSYEAKIYNRANGK